MAHWSQYEFVKISRQFFPSHFRRTRVLEIGSLDINGSVRDLFDECEYLGLDVAPGKGVDLVCQGQDFDAPTGSFDVVLSCEAMEHNPHWAETFLNMVRLCRPGGLVIMTCATTGRPEHGTARTSPTASPLTVELGWSYYRNLRRRNFDASNHLKATFSDYCFWTNWASFDLLFCGIRTGAPHQRVPMDWQGFKRHADSKIASANSRKIMRYRAIAANVGGDRWFNVMRRLADALRYAHETAYGPVWK